MRSLRASPRTDIGAPAARSVAFAFALAFVIAAAMTPRPTFAHGVGSCSQMNAAASVMQHEVDDLRRFARSALADAGHLQRANPRAAKAERADAKLFTLRANVEQDRVDGIRHNIHHCSNAGEDPDAHT